MIIMFLFLLLGLAIGYFVAMLVYVPKIRELRELLKSGYRLLNEASKIMQDFIERNRYSIPETGQKRPLNETESKDE